MQVQQHLSLWNKIQQFSIDHETAVVTFSDKLAAEQPWSKAFTQRAIEEYKKFMLLCCVSEKGAAPSKIVDEVWHLHLTYTRSYWIDFCKETLGKDIHHHPSAGGPSEDHKHIEWYNETWHLYKTVFGTNPPVDIWPVPGEGPLVLDEPVIPTRRGMLMGSLVLLFLPFLLIKVELGVFSPFSLAGADFLIFFLIYAFDVILLYIFNYYNLKRPLHRLISDNFPADVSAFQMGNFLMGQHRAIQTGMVDLVKRGLLKMKNADGFLIAKNGYTPVADEKNPLFYFLDKEEDGSFHTYREIMFGWYTKSAFSHPVLDGFKRLAKRRQPLVRFLLISLYAIAGVRMIQGLLNGRPIVNLVCETMFVSTLLVIVYRRFSRKRIVYKKVRELYESHILKLTGKHEQIVPNYALRGIWTLKGFADVALLFAIFGSYYKSTDHNEGHLTGGCGSSGCGGSSCGGGGCGGCGGGD